MNVQVKEPGQIARILPYAADDVFSQIADKFDRHPLSIWSLLGQRLVKLAQLRPGQHVLDIGSGTGAVAMPAANAVYPGGSVLGIDISQRMVDVATRRAREAGSPRLRFFHANASTYITARRLDVILGGFSLFFLEDMRASLERFRDWMSADATWAFSFWSQQPFAPLGEMLLEDLTAELPELAGDIATFAQRITHQETLAPLFSGLGGRVSISSELYHYPVGTVQQWWALATHTGLRGFIERIHPQRLEAFIQNHFRRINERFGANTFLTVELPMSVAIVRFGKG